MKKILSMGLILLAFELSNFAQENNFKPFVVKADANSCEINSLHFDIVAGLSKSDRKKVFVIFRAGKTETEIINNRRLAYVRDFLQTDRYWKTVEAIYARGEKSNDDPTIEFYLGGDLFFTSLARRNMTPCMDCCGVNYYYPQSVLKPINFKSVKTKEIGRN